MQFSVTLLPLNAVLAQTDEKSKEAKAADPIRIYLEAGINKVQEAQIREMARAIEETNVQRAKQVLGLLKEIRALSEQTELDDKRIISDQKEVNELQGQMALDRIKLLIRIRKLLSPEQKAKLVSLMGEARKSTSDSR